MFYGLNYTQEIERWSKGLHIHRWCTRQDQEAQKDIGAQHHCEMLRFSISANVTPGAEHAASSQVAGGQWQPGCGQLLHQCRTLQERAPAAPAAVLLLPTLNLIQNLQI